MSATKKSALATIAIAGLFLTACSSASESPAADSNSAAPQGLVSGDKLTVCHDPRYKPMEYREDGTSGEVKGFNVDVSREVANLWGLTDVAFAEFTVEGMFPALQTGRCDYILSSLYINEERLAVADAVALMETGPVVVTTPERQGDFSSEMDLCGVRFAVQDSTANATALRDLSDECVAAGNPAIPITEYPSPTEPVLDVLNGRSEAFLETDIAATEMVAANSGKLAVTETRVFPADVQFGIFTQKGSDVTEAVEAAVTKLREDGVLAELAEKYGLDPRTVELESA